LFAVAAEYVTEMDRRNALTVNAFKPGLAVFEPDGFDE
jgi:hypothetical protein